MHPFHFRASCSALLAIVVLAATAAHACDEHDEHSGPSPYEVCEDETLDRTPSPDGAWSAVRTRTTCIEGSRDTGIQFALLPGDAPPTAEAIFYETSVDHAYQRAEIIPAWIDNTTLLLAAPQGYVFPPLPDTYRGIQLRYQHYPKDPDAAMEGHTLEVSTQPWPMRFRAERHAGGCELDGVGPGEADGIHFYDPFLSLSSELLRNGIDQFANLNEHSAKNATKGPRLSYTVIIGADSRIGETNHRATSSGIGLLPMADHALWESHRDSRNGKWSAYYAPSHDTILQLVAALKKGGVPIKVTYWLDHKQHIYLTEKPADTTALDIFEQCVIQQKMAFGTARY